MYGNCFRGFLRCRKLSTESRCQPLMVEPKVNGASPCNGDLCTDKCHLAKYHRRNVVFGLTRKRITCLVRIRYFRAPLGSSERRYVPVKEIRIERPAKQVFRPRWIIESRASSDWLGFRAPLVTLVTCRWQVSSIYRTVKNRD